MATLNDYSNKAREAREYLTNRSTQRQAEIDKQKQQYGYNDRLKQIEGANKQLYDTEKVLSKLPQDAKRRTAGRLVTSSQLNRIVANEQQPLVQNVADLSRNVSTQNSSLDRINQALSQYGNDYDRSTDSTYGSLNNEAESLYKAYGADFNERQAREAADRESKRAASESSYQNALLALQRQQLQAASRPQQAYYSNPYAQNGGGQDDTRIEIQEGSSSAQAAKNLLKDYGKYKIDQNVRPLFDKNSSIGQKALAAGKLANAPIDMMMDYNKAALNGIKKLKWW